MDQYLNCLYSICCPPQSENQHKAFIEFLTLHGIEAGAAEAVVPVLLKHFDLAPQGTLQPFKDVIARLARGVDYQS